MQKRILSLIAILALALPLTGIFAQDATPEATAEMMVEPIELPAVDPLSVTGDIISAGSSTVFPLSEHMAELFTDEGYSGTITVDSIGSGAGFERFCTTGETDISNASRAIKDSEIEACAALTPARTPIEFRVGTDAIAIVVSSENDFVDSLTLPQLGQIFTGQVTNWSEVDPSYPDQTIQVFSPGTDSGTFTYFVEVVVTGAKGLAMAAEESEAAVLNTPGIQLSEDDNVLVQGVEGSPYAIGYFGFAYYQENRDELKALSLDAGNGMIEPNETTAEDNTYPLSRPLFLYSDAAILTEKPQVAAFINFYLTNVGDEIEGVGYFPASVEAINEAKQALLDSMGM
ncbi:MAG: PstS family phosphate ABC transporter substrate-binding protein [Chloroflexota bacterium]